MNWIAERKKNYSLKLFEKRAKKVKFPHSFVDLEQANSIGVIVNINMFTSKDLIVITDYITKLEDSGKSVFLIELNFKRRTEPMFSDTNKTVFINPTHINWLGLPSREVLARVNKYKPDILINLDNSQSMTSRFICGLANAKTRAGFYEEGFENFYELMIDLPKDTKLKSLLSAFEDYLKMIEK